MAEWLGSALQKLLQRFESAFDLIFTVNACKLNLQAFLVVGMFLTNFKHITE